MDKNPKPYTTTPRYIPEDLRSGKMTRGEWRVYQWLRINADPYGKVSTSLISIRDDVFDGATENYINTILLSLKSKEYLYYQSRQGRRGSFDVHFGDWLLPDKKIKYLDKYFSKKTIRSDSASDIDIVTEVLQTSGTPIHKLDEAKNQLTKRFSLNSSRGQFRGDYNDTDNHKDNKSTLVKKTFKGMLVSEYTPRTFEEARCHEIAKQLGEEYMNPLLHILRNHGLGIIERGWGIYREDLERNKVIDFPPAYFQGLIKKLRKKNEN